MPPKARVTIADVAAASGVGVGTVSRVINGAANVRESTRRTVLAVIKQLGYRPSYLAASLSRGTPRTIAIVVPHLTTPSAVMRLAGALAVLDEQGYDTVVCNVDTQGQRDHHLTALTSRYRVDGVIIISLLLSRQWLASFRRAMVPLVAIDVALAGIPHTVIDDVAGGRMATEHLLSLGHRRIGFVGDTRSRGKGNDLGSTSSQERLRGYRGALQEAGIGYDAGLVRRGPHGAANAEALAARLLSLPDPPSAVFADSMSSKPITDSSPGTGRAARSAAARTPIACLSDAAKTAEGGSGSDSSFAASASAFASPCGPRRTRPRS